MSPKIGAMTIQVFQDQVDGLARVFGPPALGALPAQRSLEALERRSDLVELLRRGVFLFEPENRAQTVKQIGAFGKSLQKQEERRLVDRKSTRLNSSHVAISYAVFCLKKKNLQN